MMTFKAIWNEVVTPSMMVGLGILFSTTAATAQFTGNPFDPYQAAYRSSSIPTYAPGGPFSGSARAVPPGLGVVPGFLGATPMARDLNSLRWGLGPGLGVGTGLGDELGPVPPYHEAHRRYDEEFSRIYRPNTFGPGGSVDEQYFENRKARDQLYFQAMNESDPQKKAELLRQYRQASEKAALGLSRQSRVRPGAAANQRGSGTTASSPRVSDTDSLTRTIETYEDLLQESLAIDYSLTRKSQSLLESPPAIESSESDVP